MSTKYKKIKKLFLQQSYLDSWENYVRSLQETAYITWDYVVLTASNEELAKAYRWQLKFRLNASLLSAKTKYVVLADPDGKRVGSGGATLNVLKYISEQDTDPTQDHFVGKRILVIHSGGDSKRIPQYSAVGKLFSPVPRELPNGRPSTLFDELIIAMAGVAGRIADGMLVLSGDALLLFNPLQIDAQFQGAAAISIKESTETGKDHGVFINDGSNHVDRFLHKKSEHQLRTMGATDEQDLVNLDTGAVILDTMMLNALFRLISTNNQVNELKFSRFVNEKSRISFYGDFLYPLAKKSTLYDFYRESPEGSFCDELMACRTEIWEVLRAFRMTLLCLSPAEFIHFGTTREFLELMTQKIDDYEFLGWKRQVCTNYIGSAQTVINNSLVADDVIIEEHVYIEDSIVGKGSVIGVGSIVSNMEITGMVIPANTVFHGLKIKNDCYITRVYGIADNSKGNLEENTEFLGTKFCDFVEKNNLTVEDLWDKKEHSLWLANLYPVCASKNESIKWALILCMMVKGQASKEEVCEWKKKERLSLYSSLNRADVQVIVPWKQRLENSIIVEKFCNRISSNISYRDALHVFGELGITKEQYEMLMKRVENSGFSLRIRILYDISRYMKESNKVFDGKHFNDLEKCCFTEIKKVIYNNGMKAIATRQNLRILKKEVDISLPVRVNWGGGWTDTPPYCNENGGTVLNAAITLNGKYPVQVSIRKLDKLQIEFESPDINVKKVIETMEEIQELNNPYDFFSLHKAALIACGIVPMEAKGDLVEILENLGGGFCLSTQVNGVPKGSGLGTSSILAAACAKAIFEFFGQALSDSELYDIVLCMEQIMTTGGGWQDQVGGVVPGIKFITTKPGIAQRIQVKPVILEKETIKELQERFALIYTGQRRLARNLLRDVVGNYIGGKAEALCALKEMEQTAALMKYELEKGDIDAFANLLNSHWELSKQLDSSCTNTCIDQIFLACEDLIDGKFIVGAGGGGFLQVIMKKGIKREDLSKRLYEVFQNSGVTAWKSEFVF